MIARENVPAVMKGAKSKGGNQKRPQPTIARNNAEMRAPTLTEKRQLTDNIKKLNK